MKALNNIQKELKAPKGQTNTFGNYKYRSCEDILEAVKPLLGDCVLTVSDEVVNIGDRYYVKATATLKDGDLSESVSAFAREPLTKKGMDEAQITGATSSYARKYALNGLFAIDDTKDADTQDNTEKVATAKPIAQPVKATAFSSAKKAIEKTADFEDLQKLKEQIHASKVLTADEKEQLEFMTENREALMVD